MCDVETLFLATFGILLGAVILVLLCLEKCGDVFGLVLLLEIIPDKNKSETEVEENEFVMVVMDMLGLLAIDFKGAEPLNLLATAFKAINKYDPGCV